MARSTQHELAALARLYGVQTAYYDVSNRRQTAGVESLLGIVRALGAPVDRLTDVSDALRAERQARVERMVEPAHVVWQSKPCEILLRIPSAQAGGTVDCRIRCEDGQTLSSRRTVGEMERVGEETVEGVDYVVLRLDIPDQLPIGYHWLAVEHGSRRSESLLISAPLKAFTGAVGRRGAWGVFAPLYALHSRRSWGAGDFADLESLMNWVADLGGDCVATLPLLAAFPDSQAGVSPYSPASRLFWDETYIDVDRLVRDAPAPLAGAAVADAEFRAAISELQASPVVDYSRVSALKRRILEMLAEAFFAAPATRRAEFDRFVASRPEVDDYARFRAVKQQRGEPWPAWPERLRDGRLEPGDFDESARRYHLFAQWIADEQLRALAAAGNNRQLTWYLDLPLGVHASGYDVWRHRDAFALGARGGAPPDPVFTKGQDWGFPPLDPARLRESGYGYFIDVLRHHLRYTGLLRIDHVMGLHRLYWIPEGAEARHGAYVRYPADELYGILAIESHRHRAWIVGENLGTVPRSVNSSMRRHGIYGMYVVQYEMQASAGKRVAPPSRMTVASLNTHDMPPFAAFCRGLDIDDRVDLGLITKETAAAEHAERARQLSALANQLRGEVSGSEQPEVAAMLRSLLQWLGASPTRLVLVNLEDLWLATAPQNTPGTTWERLNWQRKLEYDLETLCRLPAVVDALRDLDRVRKGLRNPLPPAAAAETSPSENCVPG